MLYETQVKFKVYLTVLLVNAQIGTKCARSEDCVSGILTGEGTKCGPKKIEEIRLKHVRQRRKYNLLCRHSLSLMRLE